MNELIAALLRSTAKCAKWVFPPKGGNTHLAPKAVRATAPRLAITLRFELRHRLRGYWRFSKPSCEAKTLPLPLGLCDRFRRAARRCCLGYRTDFWIRQVNCGYIIWGAEQSENFSSLTINRKISDGFAASDGKWYELNLLAFTHLKYASSDLDFTLDF